MSAKTASITTANLVRTWIVLGLGALIVLVIFMIQPPASARQAAAAVSPCATSAAAAPCQPCTHGPKCSPCPSAQCYNAACHSMRCQCHAGSGACPCAA